MQMVWQILLMLSLPFLEEVSCCSPPCACIWKNGKETVECKKKNLSDIPEGLDPATQVLDFSGNKVGFLQKDLFLKKQLVNLQRLYLSNSLIKSVDKGAFEGLTNLVELDLSQNLLDSIPSGAFIRSPNLMKLILSVNPITVLKKSAFQHLTQLNILELRDCNIRDIEEGAFQGLHSLEWLHLDGNRLKTISGRRTLPEYIKGIDLEKNPWECDCNMQDLATWLKEFKSLLSVEPICHGPPRLATHTIRSIPITELACLPNTSPTSFYLELGEGKNVSLMCHIHAIPEAHVSWWFHGQMLQNDTVVTPGVHLIYFVEEGTENKRSELFIYNANAEDNGTFICTAENIAGISQSNFTIRIILKENPIVIVVSFPFEYILIAVVGISILGVSVLIALVALIVKCRRRKRITKKVMLAESNSASQYQQHYGKLGDGVKSLSDSLKQLNTQNHNEHLKEFEMSSCDLSNRTVSPSLDNHLMSGDPLMEIQLKQNPDIINGCRREGDGKDYQTLESYDDGELSQTMQIPIARLRESTEFLDGGRCIVDPEGYPVDYGLPKVCKSQTQFPEGYYRTLPSNRLKRHSAANPFRRISREAEFLSRSVDSPYDNSVDIRYTADGYPARPSLQPSTYPVENVLVDTVQLSSLPYCSVQWPTCVPANIHVLSTRLPPSMNVANATYGGHPQNLSKRSASAQTENDSEDCFDATEQQFLNMATRMNVIGIESPGNAQSESVSEVLTESPDEGYEGEPSVV